MSGALDKPRVFDADTGEELQDVKAVRLVMNGGHYASHSCEITLTNVEVDVVVNAAAINAISYEDGTYSRTKLLDVRRLRWRRAS